MTGSKSTPDCSIVIRAFNEAKHIGKILAGIQQQTVQNCEIILVDSGSTDDTAAIASRAGATVVHISPDEFTFGRSLNLGIAHCSAPKVVIASAHVYPVYPDWLEHLLNPLEDAQIALSYGKQRGASNSYFSERQIFQQWYPEQSIQHQHEPFCNNANAAIQKTLWLKHPYDESLTGLEDIAWAKWAIEQGYFISYQAEAEVIHVHQETPQAVYNRYRREAMAFKRIFPHESFSVGDLMRLTSTNITNDLWHAARVKKFTSCVPSVFWFRFMQFWGTYRGYRQSGPLTTNLRQTFYYPKGFRNISPPNQRDVKPIQYPDG